MVGLVENALEEIKEKMNPDRIIIESRFVLLFSGRYELKDIVVQHFQLLWHYVYESLNPRDSSWMV
jgi:hypothetical protein